MKNGFPLLGKLSAMIVVVISIFMCFAFCLRIPEPEMRLKNLWQTCNKLPKANFENLKYLVKFLAKLATNSETNKMSIQNVAIAIAPSLIWAPKANDAAFE